MTPNCEIATKLQTVGIAVRSECVGVLLQPLRLFLQLKSDGNPSAFYAITTERKEGVFLPETPLYISSFLLYILGLIPWVLFI